MNNNDLLPCPFCGGGAEEIALEDEDNLGGSVIQCKKCFASSQVQFNYKETLREKWNYRTPAPPQERDTVTESGKDEALIERVKEALNKTDFEAGFEEGDEDSRNYWRARTAVSVIAAEAMTASPDNRRV